MRGARRKQLYKLYMMICFRRGKMPAKGSWRAFKRMYKRGTLPTYIEEQFPHE